MKAKALWVYILNCVIRRLTRIKGSAEGIWQTRNTTCGVQEILLLFFGGVTPERLWTVEYFERGQSNCKAPVNETEPFSVARHVDLAENGTRVC